MWKYKALCKALEKERGGALRQFLCWEGHQYSEDCTWNEAGLWVLSAQKAPPRGCRKWCGAVEGQQKLQSSKCEGAKLSPQCTFQARNHQLFSLDFNIPLQQSGDSVCASYPPTEQGAFEVCDRNVSLSPDALPKDGHQIRFSIRDKSLYCPLECFFHIAMNTTLPQIRTSFQNTLLNEAFF